MAIKLKNPQFELSHKLGRIQTHNIHDRHNLVALCSICHFAFDNDEWTLIPEDIAVWLNTIKSEPQSIQRYNGQRDVVYRRLLLDQSSRDTTASQDHDFKSAFIETPLKVCPCEAGLLFVRQMFHEPADPSAEVEEMVDQFIASRYIWRKVNLPCPVEDCPICSPEEGNDEEEEEANEEDDNNAEKNEESAKDKEEGNEDDNNDDGEENDDGDDGEEADDSDYDEEDEEDDQDNEDDDQDSKEVNDDDEISSSGEKNDNSKEQMNNGKHERPSQKIKGAERDWLTSAPYDKKVPFSYRYGYTYMNSTSNDEMQRWQAFRKPSEPRFT